MPYKVTLPPGEPTHTLQGVSPTPEKAGTPGTAGDTPAPWDLLTDPPDPRERLTGYLDAWARMDEAAWPEANVRALYEDILDLFREYPEAERWYRDWRAAHPEARLA